MLIKPQFEAGREHVGKGGIVREQAGARVRHRARQGVRGGAGRDAEIEVIDSPIHGMEGNQEFLLHARFGEQRPNTDSRIKPIRPRTEKAEPFLDPRI